MEPTSERLTYKVELRSIFPQPSFEAFIFIKRSTSIVLLRLNLQLQLLLLLLLLVETASIGIVHPNNFPPELLLF